MAFNEIPNRRFDAHSDSGGGNGSLGEPAKIQFGRVFLVGAGPGDPGLMTVRGRDCLQQADAVLYDYLVNPVLLEHASPTAELVSLGSHAKGKLWQQDQINEELVKLARQGKTVVRLKSGDPAVFARGAEEAETLAQHGISFEIVPGITAALAAGSCAGIPVTHRELASAVALVTGHERAGQENSKLDYQSLANFPGTLVFYMGTTTVESWSQGLMSGGMSPETPVAIVRRCSFPDQTRQHCRLDEVASIVQGPPRIRPPVIFIVGPVTSLAPKLNWFEQRPLFGQRIWVTRPQAQASSLAHRLRELGADAAIVPAIEIEPIRSPQIDEAIERLSTYDFVVFSSSNGVDSLLHRLKETGRDARQFGSAQLVAIGPGTAHQLAQWHLQADQIPERFDADALADLLTDQVTGKRLLLIRASRGREVLAERLSPVAAQVDQVVVYNSHDVEAVDPSLPEALSAGQVDWVTVTSSAIGRSLIKLFGDDLKKTRLASISPITSETLRQLGYSPAAEATTYTMDGLIDAICRSTAPAD